MRALAALCLLVGCSDTVVDLTGMYRVDVAVGSTPCGDDQPLPSIPPFLKFGKSEFVGQDYFKYDACNDEAGTDCPVIGGLNNGFFEPVDNGWRGVAITSVRMTDGCLLIYLERTATLDKTKLVIEAASYTEKVDLPAEKCQPEEAERRNDSMPCAEHLRIDGTQLTTTP